MPLEDPLFTPFELGTLRLRNRIVSTSHEPAYGEDGLPKDRYRAYHVEKARGGVALTMMGGSALVSRDSAPAFGNLQLWRPEAEPWLRRIADDVHGHGAAIMTQLTHLGHRTSNYTHDWLPAVSVSAIREPAHRAFARAAEDWDLDRIVADFVETSQRCQAAGLDGIEFMLHGHLLDAFWTPYWNRREDEFGGALENRLRFPLRVVAAVRAAVGPEFLLGARMTFDEDRPGGLEVAEALSIAAELEAVGIDFFSVLRGSIATDADLARMIPPMATPSAPHLDFVGQIKQKLTVPIMHAGRIADIPTARYAVREGLVDLIGMTRAIMADPELPNKVRDGHGERIRPCVGASMCIDNIYSSGSAYCIHNPSTGREQTVPQRVVAAPQVKRVAVVGAGPAGLEAARVLAERGHQVVVFEANDAVGGQLALAALAPRRRDLQGILDWRIQELGRLGVPIRLNTFVEASTLRGEQWDVVVVATGGMPAVPDVPGGDLALDTWDVLSGARRIRGHVAVYDDHGGNQALDAVEALLRGGATVDYLTPERSIAPDVGTMTGSAYFDVLARAQTSVTVLRRLTAVTQNGAGVILTLGVDGSTFRERRSYDAVVAEMGVDPVTDLYDQLRPDSSNGGAVDFHALLDNRPQTVVANPAGQFQLFRIGDSVASRNVHAAMLDAARLGRGV